MLVVVLTWFTVVRLALYPLIFMSHFIVKITGMSILDRIIGAAVGMLKTYFTSIFLMLILKTLPLLDAHTLDKSSAIRIYDQQWSLVKEIKVTKKISRLALDYANKIFPPQWISYFNSFLMDENH